MLDAFLKQIKLEINFTQVVRTQSIIAAAN